MKTFTQFVTEIRIPKDVPSGIVSHGSHSIHHGAPQVTQGDLGPDGVPCGVIFHGSHSNDPDAKQMPDVRNLKESEKTFFDKNENTHIGKEVGDVHNKLISNQKREGLDHAHLFAYTMGSRMVNSVLWSAHKYNKEVPNIVHGFAGQSIDVKGLDSAINRNKLHDDLHVYSGVARDISKEASKHPDNHYHLPAYTSTSINKDIAHLFASNIAHDRPKLKTDGVVGHVLHVKVPKGHAGAYLSSASKYDHEKEFLLPRDTTLKMTHHTDHEDSYGEKIRVHHGEIVPKVKAKKK